jgi:hypothetical protein
MRDEHLMSTNDPDFYQAPKFSPEAYPPPPRQHGCFFYGCIIASILAVLMAILFAVLGYVAYRGLSQLVEQYTSTTPRQLPKVEMPAEQRAALKDRVDSFRKAVDAGTPAEPLVLTSDDLNALIDENEDLKGKVYVAVEGDKLKGQVSLPLDMFKLPMVRGRYLNGEADFKASLLDGVLIVTLDSVEINGKKLPEEILTGMRQQNLAKDVYKDPKNAEMMRKLESLEIKDGKIVLKLRAKAGASSDSSTAKKALPVEVIAPPAGTPKTEPAPAQAPNTKTPSPPAEAALPKT